MGAEVAVGKWELTPFIHHADGRSDPLAYIICTMCKSCYLVNGWIIVLTVGSGRIIGPLVLENNLRIMGTTPRISQE